MKFAIYLLFLLGINAHADLTFPSVVCVNEASIGNPSAVFRGFMIYGKPPLSKTSFPPIHLGNSPTPVYARLFYSVDSIKKEAHQTPVAILRSPSEVEISGLSLPNIAHSFSVSLQVKLTGRTDFPYYFTATLRPALTRLNWFVMKMKTGDFQMRVGGFRADTK